MRLPPAAIGVVLFAVMLGALQWATTGRLTWLPLRVLLVAAAGYAFFILVPWARLLAVLPADSWFFRRALFFVFLHHFVLVMLQETHRLYVARRLAAPRSFGAGFFSSLTHATSALFSRSLHRAERFYAALLLRDLKL